MQTQKQTLIAVVRSESMQSRETACHGFACVWFVVVVWFVFGNSKVDGQEYEMISPGRGVSTHGVLEWSEPILSGYAGTGYVVEGQPIASTPHRVLQPPVANPLRTTTSQYSPSPYGPSPNGLSSGDSARSGHVGAGAAKDVFDETLHTDGPLLRRLHEHKQPPQAKIPQATVEPQWKAPYAYGYFGASGTKHWIKSSGYRDTYKRWTKQ